MTSLLTNGFLHALQSMKYAGTSAEEELLVHTDALSLNLNVTVTFMTL